MVLHPFKQYNDQSTKKKKKKFRDQNITYLKVQGPLEILTLLIKMVFILSKLMKYIYFMIIFYYIFSYP